jgi:hypothetical protein
MVTSPDPSQHGASGGPDPHGGQCAGGPCFLDGSYWGRSEPKADIANPAQIAHVRHWPIVIEIVAINGPSASLTDTPHALHGCVIILGRSPNRGTDRARRNCLPQLEQAGAGLVRPLCILPNYGGTGVDVIQSKGDNARSV